MKGHKVKAGDILVGKITPRLQVFSTPADKLLEGIFGVKARSVKDTSLRVLNGEEGIVHSVQRFSKKYGHQLPVDVQEIVKIYIVQRRHLNEGDKLSGRHGDKGVVSRIVPIEDMPHLPDGTPIDVILNPLGIPSRMNIGQVLELHLGLAAKKLDIKIATPVFDGLTSSEIDDIMQEAQISNLGCTTIIEGMDGEVSSKPISVGIKYLSKL
jgi:DNA-directed RNA polymerase subunit beta